VSKKVSVSRKLIGKTDIPEEVLPFPNLSVPTAHMAGVVYNDRVFIVGGTTPDGYSDKMWYLRLDQRIRAKGTNPADPVRLIWRSLPAWQQAARSHCAAVIQNDGLHDCIWVLGGRHKSATGSWELRTDAQKFNLQTRTWLQMSDVRVLGEASRSVMGAGIVARGFGGIHVLGGDPGPLSDGKRSYSPDILLFSTLTDSWDVETTFDEPTPLAAPLVEWGEDFIVASGEIRPGMCSTTIWKMSFSE
jgi:N-acetylneuraminic acid mutarotase